MKKHLIPAVAVAALAIATPPAAHADTAKVIINGQDITADTANSGQNFCAPENGGYAYVLSLGSLPVPGTVPGSVMVRLSYPDQAKVMFVNVKKGDQLWSTQQGQPQQGTANVTKTGNSYKVTGTIAPFANNGNNVGTPVPFEIDATCP